MCTFIRYITVMFNWQCAMIPVRILHFCSFVLVDNCTKLIYQHLISYQPSYLSSLPVCMKITKNKPYIVSCDSSTQVGLLLHMHAKYSVKYRRAFLIYLSHTLNYDHNTSFSLRSHRIQNDRSYDAKTIVYIVKFTLANNHFNCFKTKWQRTLMTL